MYRQIEEQNSSASPGTSDHSPRDVGPIHSAHPTAVNTADHVILLLGPSGTGKSSFIAQTTGHDVPVGHSIDSCTNRCSTYDCIIEGNRIILIDTPGFNDTKLDDQHVLENIIDFLRAARFQRVSTFLYFHKITENKMTGSMGVNIRLLKALSGKDFYPRVCFVTTMWHTVPDSLYATCEERETRLQNSPNYWGDMIASGSRVFRQVSDRDLGIAFLRDFLAPPDLVPLPTVMDEINANIPYRCTESGRILAEILQKREAKHIRELEEERQDAEEERRTLAKARQRLETMPTERSKLLEEVTLSSFWQVVWQLLCGHLGGDRGRNRGRYC